MNKIALRANGQDFSYWQSARVTRGIESIAGSFDLTVTDRWSQDEKPWDIVEEDVCQILLNGSTVITGFVDEVSTSYSDNSHSLRITGRDRTGQLVDCSADLGKWEYWDISLKTLAEKLCKPFGVNVALQSGLVLPKSPNKFSIDPGDTAFTVLEHACRLAGALPISDGNGGLILTRAGTSRATTALVEGENILSASATFNASGKFRTYKVLGQHKGSDEFFGPAASRIKATATDQNVRRSDRILIVRPEGNTTTEHAKRRAEWEATVRAARGSSISVTVAGWTQGDGSLWPVNALVQVRSKRIRIQGEMLITQAVHTVSDRGTYTELTLRPPEAFKPEPVITKAANRWRELDHGA